MHSISRLSKNLPTNCNLLLQNSKVFSPFSSASAVAQKNYNLFRKNYDGYVKGFQDQVNDLEKANRPKTVKAPVKAFVHPFHSEHHPLNFSPVKTAELFHDFVGPELVSPHYENFLTSRKYLMAFWAGLLAINFGIATIDLQWIAKSSYIPFIFWFQIMYFYMEAKKSFFKPLLARFYRRASANEVFNFEVYYHENIESKLQEMMRVAKGQLDYWDLHSSYRDVKANSINNFLANEYMNLQRHLNERTLNILKSVKAAETSNTNRLMSDVINQAISQIDKSLEGSDRAQIESKFFDAAIDGLAKGACDYAADPLLPIVIRSLEKNVDNINKLSPEEQAKQIAITNDQLVAIKAADERARSEFTHGVPQEIEASFKSNETVQKILQTWGQ